MFSQLCSIYADAHDNVGRYVDPRTKEKITSMSVQDFCLSGTWKDVILELRSMIAKYGVKDAKSMEEYRRLKTLLPGATLSGLFKPALVETEKVNRHTGEAFTVQEEVSRRTSHLFQHTGFICIDIDLQDNQTLNDLQIIVRILQHRPEVALLMKSCSGTGYFALIPISYPSFHKEHFRALQREYASLGIVIDKQCGDVTRIRFASYDDSPYVNRNAICYSGIDIGDQMSYQRSITIRNDKCPGSTSALIDRVERIVKILERLRIDITNDYADWIRVGYSLANLPEPYGRDFFHRVSAICTKYNSAVCDKQFNHLCSPQKIGIGTFFKLCEYYGVTLKHEQ